MICRKHGISVTGCSRSLKCEMCSTHDMNAEEKSSFTSGPISRVSEREYDLMMKLAHDRGWLKPVVPGPEKKPKKKKADCSVCKRPVFDNVNAERIITCARCVQPLLTTSQEKKVRLRDKLNELGDMEAARSIEAFISEEEGCGDIATSKIPLLQAHSKAVLSTFRPVLRPSTKEAVR
jgi:hypothetical protein